MRSRSTVQRIDALILSSRVHRARAGRLYNLSMADPLYFSLWFPNLRLEQLQPHLVNVLRQLPAPAVHAATVYPLDWQQTPIFQRVYGNESTGAVPPDEAAAEAFEALHDDYAYEFEAHWRLWMPESDGMLDTLWREQQQPLRITAFGPEFDQSCYQQQGHIRIDLGLDTPFLCEEIELDGEGKKHLQQNVLLLVALTKAVEKNCGAETRLLWTEGEDNMASKLIARLQKN